MFIYTHTVDNAVARYETDAGLKVAFALDDDAPNPVVEDGYSIGIRRFGRGWMPTDPHGLLEDWERAGEAIEEAEDVASLMGLTLEEALAKLEPDEDRSAGEEELYPVDEEIFRACLNAMEERKDMVRIVWTDYAEWGEPCYEVVYSLEGLANEGWNLDRADEIVKGLAREYSAWANGSMYVMGVETVEGDEEFYGCPAGFDPHGMNDVAEELDVHGYSSKGLKESWSL